MENLGEASADESVYCEEEDAGPDAWQNYKRPAERRQDWSQPTYAAEGAMENLGKQPSARPQAPPPPPLARPGPALRLAGAPLCLELEAPPCLVALPARDGVPADPPAGLCRQPGAAGFASTFPRITLIQ